MKIQQCLTTAARAAWRLFSRHTVFSDMLFAQHLRDRICALERGIALHGGPAGSAYGLRRGIHRLEKGLATTPRRDIFAETYIDEVVRQYAEVAKQPHCHATTLAWSRATLDAYFEQCVHSETVARAHTEYMRIRRPSTGTSAAVASTAAERPALSVNYDALRTLALRRRSIRSFLDQPVPPPLIRKAVELALLSPSACNRQAFRFRIVTRKDRIVDIAELAGGITGHQIPVLGVVTGLFRGYANPRDLDAIQIDASLALMSFMFALETLGLSSVCINWPRITKQDTRIRKLMALDPDEVVVMLVGIGYADPRGAVLASAKSDLEENLWFEDAADCSESSAPGGGAS